ncbi:SLC13 family permease [Virgibacillus ihumii]|uniref:SLC13 family permease n=1 Tax=Virgibacillus ihumii TaxID=2686091 RepID=UPI00157CD4D6|nr:DASS family sodium-coupled anion symporter [Virgibacillus ihumii]
MSKSNILVILAVAIYVIVVSPLLFEWNVIVQTFGVLVIAQILWIGGALPSPVTALILMLMISLHFFSFEETLSFLGSDVVWLLFSTFLIAGAFLESGLAYRMSLYVLRFSRGSGRLLLLLLMFLILMLSVLVPTNIGRGNLIVSVIDKISGSLKEFGKADNIAKTLFIGGCFVVTLSGAAVITGANSTLYAFSMFNRNGSIELNYLTWMLLFIPPIMLFIVILWITLLKLYPPEKIRKNDVIRFIHMEIVRLGKMQASEIKMIIIISVTVVLWIIQPVHGYSISMVGMFGAVLTLLPVIGIWDWSKAQKEIDWGMFLFFGSTLILSHLLIETGSLNIIANGFVEIIPSNATIVILGLVIVGTMLLRTLFVSVLGFMTIMIPLGLEIGKQLGTISPVLIAMVVFLAGVPGFFLVTQSPVNMIYYTYGAFNKKDILRVGGVAGVLWIAIVLISAEFYWQLIM